MSLFSVQVIQTIKQTVFSVKTFSLIGVFLLLTISFQCISGVMLAMSLVPESMMIPVSRETEDMDVLYIDDFFWLHERGVDFVYIFLIFHFFRKTFQRSNGYLSESSWKSGSFMFLLLHGVIFTGLVLCCSHLSDITLKIATNIVNTLTNKVGSACYFIFTDESLNTDTILRITYLHYILPFLVLLLSYDHLVDMHFNHRDYVFTPLRRVSYNWSKEVFREELYYYFNWLCFFSI